MDLHSEIGDWEGLARDGVAVGGRCRCGVGGVDRSQSVGEGEVVGGMGARRDCCCCW